MLIAFVRTHPNLVFLWQGKAEIFDLSRATADNPTSIKFYQGNFGRRHGTALDSFSFTFVSFSCRCHARDHVRREKEGELATTSLEFEYLHRKSRCGDDISNGVITLGTCFSMFVYIRPPFSLRADWRKSDSSVDGEPQGNWRWNSNSRDVVASSYFLFPPSCQSAP